MATWVFAQFYLPLQRRGVAQVWLHDGVACRADQQERRTLVHDFRANIYPMRGGLMAERSVIELAEREGLGLGSQQFTCANPRCDEQFIRTASRGRPKDFHSEDCRRAALRDLRRIQAQLAHHERQADQLRARAGAYLRTSATDTDTDASSGPTVDEVRAAREAIAEVRGMARFLDGHQDELARDLLHLWRAVEPLVR